jgi:hypothetical protein
MRSDADMPGADRTSGSPARSAAVARRLIISGWTVPECRRDAGRTTGLRRAVASDRQEVCHMQLVRLRTVSSFNLYLLSKGKDIDSTAFTIPQRMESGIEFSTTIDIKSRTASTEKQIAA